MPATMPRTSDQVTLKARRLLREFGFSGAIDMVGRIRGRGQGAEWFVQMAALEAAVNSEFDAYGEDRYRD